MPVDWINQVVLKDVLQAARDRQDAGNVAAEFDNRSRSLARKRSVIEAQGLEIDGPDAKGSVVLQFSVGSDEMDPAALLESATVDGYKINGARWSLRILGDGRVRGQLAGQVDDAGAVVRSGTVNLEVSFKDTSRDGPRTIRAFTVRGAR
jgi:hypothetical protein